MIKIGRLKQREYASIREVETDAKIRRQGKIPTLSLSVSVCVSARVMGIWDGAILCIYVGEFM